MPKESIESSQHYRSLSLGRGTLVNIFEILQRVFLCERVKYHSEALAESIVTEYLMTMTETLTSVRVIVISFSQRKHSRSQSFSFLLSSQLTFQTHIIILQQSLALL